SRGEERVRCVSYEPRRKPAEGRGAGRSENVRQPRRGAKSVPSRSGPTSATLLAQPLFHSPESATVKRAKGRRGTHIVGNLCDPLRPWRSFFAGKETRP